MQNISETTNEGTGASQTADAISAFRWALLFAVPVGLLIGSVFGVDPLKVVAVALALATLYSLIPVLEVGWFELPLLVTILGLVVAVPFGILFGSIGFFAVFAVFFVLGISLPFLMGTKGREEVRRIWRRRQKSRVREEQRQQAATLRGAEQEGDEGHIASVLPHELRALPYEEYLQTPHWKRKREDKLRTVGRRCQMCSRSSGTIDVHHNTYERLGEELDGDLIVLCRGCHSWHHEKRHFGR